MAIKGRDSIIDWLRRSMGLLTLTFHATETISLGTTYIG
jgi:hypothetical protein